MKAGRVPEYYFVTVVSIIHYGGPIMNILLLNTQYRPCVRRFLVFSGGERVMPRF